MKNIFVLLLIIFYIVSSNAQSCDFDSTILKLSLKNDTIKATNPIFYNVILENISSEERQIIHPWKQDIILPQLEFRHISEKKWNVLIGSTVGSRVATSNNGGYYRIDMPSGGTIALNSEWIDLPLKFKKNNRELCDVRNVFSKGGIYELRVRIPLYDVCKGVNLKSNIVTLVVVEHKGVDKLAHDWLLKNVPHPAVVYGMLPRDGYVSSRYIYYIGEQQPIEINEKLDEFINKFPTSIFTPWAKLYLAHWYYLNIKKREYTSDYYPYGRYYRDVQTIEKVKLALTLLEEIKESETINSDLHLKKLTNRFYKEAIRTHKILEFKASKK